MFFILLCTTEKKNQRKKLWGFICNYESYEGQDRHYRCLAFKADDIIFINTIQIDSNQIFTQDVH